MEKTPADINRQIDLFYIALKRIDNELYLPKKVEDCIHVKPRFENHHDIVRLCFTDIKALPVKVREMVAQLFYDMFPNDFGAPVVMTHQCDENGRIALQETL